MRRYHNRGELVRKAFLVVREMMRPGGCTAAEIQQVLGCSNKTAYRYIHVCEELLPVERNGESPTRYFIEAPQRWR